MKAKLNKLVGIRFDPAVLERLRGLADKNHMDVSTYIRIIIVNHMDVIEKLTKCTTAHEALRIWGEHIHEAVAILKNHR